MLVSLHHDGQRKQHLSVPSIVRHASCFVRIHELPFVACVFLYLLHLLLEGMHAAVTRQRGRSHDTFFAAATRRLVRDRLQVTECMKTMLDHGNKNAAMKSRFNRFRVLHAWVLLCMFSLKAAPFSLHGWILYVYQAAQASTFLCHCHTLPLVQSCLTAEARSPPCESPRWKSNAWRWNWWKIRRRCLGLDPSGRWQQPATPSRVAERIG